MIDFKIKKTKYTVVIALTVLIALVIVLLTLLGRSTLMVLVEPTNAIVRVNNAPININDKGQSRVLLKPGQATIAVEADGYISDKQVLTLKKAGIAKHVVSLIPNPIPIVLNEGQKVNINVQTISLADEENSVFYLGDNGSALYKAQVALDEEGNIKVVYNRQISNPPLSGIKKVIWSPKKDAAMFKKDDGAYFFDFKKYNFISQEEVKYGEHIGDIAWSPDDSKIAYYYAPPNGEKSLIFANKTNSEITRVANFSEMAIENPYLSWSPSSEWLIVIPRNKDLNSNKIYLFNAYTRSFKTVSDSGFNVEAVFNRTGDKIMYSSYSPEEGNPNKFVLSEMNIDGENKRNLEIRAYASRIEFTNKESRDIIVSNYDNTKKVEAIFPFNMDDKKDFAFKIFLDSNTSANSLVLNLNDNILFYVSDGKLYAVSLAKVK